MGEGCRAHVAALCVGSGQGGGCAWSSEEEKWPSSGNNERGADTYTSTEPEQRSTQLCRPRRGLARSLAATAHGSDSRCSRWFLAPLAGRQNRACWRERERIIFDFNEIYTLVQGPVPAQVFSGARAGVGGAAPPPVANANDTCKLFTARVSRTTTTSFLSDSTGRCGA